MAAVGIGQSILEIGHDAHALSPAVEDVPHIDEKKHGGADDQDREGEGADGHQAQHAIAANVLQGAFQMELQHGQRLSVLKSSRRW